MSLLDLLNAGKAKEQPPAAPKVPTQAQRAAAEAARHAALATSNAAMGLGEEDLRMARELAEKQGEAMAKQAERDAMMLEKRRKDVPAVVHSSDAGVLLEGRLQNIREEEPFPRTTSITVPLEIEVARQKSAIAVALNTQLMFH
eukprot:TRINITY_DN30642_c0_g1_i5.p2 TRINITY_DN30642_c0_g1~~TRINITY_DN30642_c0_g1_i5.p2  ORF type:complete len:144 (-),score=52.58 TRINITY_DN30642_c0_g1_i5:33-464(-)